MNNNHETFTGSIIYGGYILLSTSLGRVFLWVGNWFYPYHEETPEKTLAKAKQEVDLLNETKKELTN